MEEKLGVLINMNPYQGLKQFIELRIYLTYQSSNQHESLSGIETDEIVEQILEEMRSNQHESLSGIETSLAGV